MHYDTNINSVQIVQKNGFEVKCTEITKVLRPIFRISMAFPSRTVYRVQPTRALQTCQAAGAVIACVGFFVPIWVLAKINKRNF